MWACPLLMSGCLQQCQSGGDDERYLNAASDSSFPTRTRARAASQQRLFGQTKVCCRCCVSAIIHHATRHGADAPGTGLRPEGGPEDVTAAPEPLAAHEAEARVNTKGTAEKEPRWWGEQRRRRRRRQEGEMGEGERVSHRPQLQFTKTNIYFETGLCAKIPPACRIQATGLRCQVRTSPILFRERCWSAQRGSYQEFEVFRLR